MDNLLSLLAAHDIEDVILQLPLEKRRDLFTGLCEAAIHLGFEGVLPNQVSTEQINESMFALLDFITIRGQNIAADSRALAHDSMGLYEGEDNNAPGSTVISGWETEYEDRRYAIELPANKKDFILLDLFIESELGISLNSAEAKHINEVANRLASDSRSEVFLNGNLLGYAGDLIGFYSISGQESGIFISPRLKEYFKQNIQLPDAPDKKPFHITAKELCLDIFKISATPKNIENIEDYIRVLAQNSDEEFELYFGRTWPIGKLVEIQKDKITFHKILAARILKNTQLEVNLSVYNKLLVGEIGEDVWLSRNEAFSLLNIEDNSANKKAFNSLVNDLWRRHSPALDGLPVNDLTKDKIVWASRGSHKGLYIHRDIIHPTSARVQITREAVYQQLEQLASLAWRNGHKWSFFAPRALLRSLKDKNGCQFITTRQFIENLQSRDFYALDKYTTEFEVYLEKLLIEKPDLIIQENPNLTLTEAIKTINIGSNKLTLISEAALPYFRENYLAKIRSDSTQWIKGHAICAALGIDTTKENYEAIATILTELYNRRESISVEYGVPENRRTENITNLIKWGAKGVNSGDGIFIHRELVGPSVLPHLITKHDVAATANAFYKARNPELTIVGAVKYLFGVSTLQTDNNGEIQKLYKYLVFNLKENPEYVIDEKSGLTLSEAIKYEDINDLNSFLLSNRLLPFLEENFLGQMSEANAHWILSGDIIDFIPGVAKHADKHYQRTARDFVNQLWLAGGDVEIRLLNNTTIRTRDIIRRLKNNTNGYVGMFVDPAYASLLISEFDLKALEAGSADVGTALPSYRSHWLHRTADICKILHLNTVVYGTTVTRVIEDLYRKRNEITLLLPNQSDTKLLSEYVVKHHSGNADYIAIDPAIVGGNVEPQLISANIIRKRNSFSHVLKYYRGKQKLSIKELAVKTNCYESYLIAVEAGIIIPDEVNLQAICLALNIEVNSVTYDKAKRARDGDKISLEAELNDPRKVSLMNVLASINTQTQLYQLFAGFVHHVGRGNQPGPIDKYTTREISTNVPRHLANLKKLADDGMPRMRPLNIDVLLTNDREAKGTKPFYGRSYRSRERIGILANATAKLLDEHPELQEFAQKIIEDIAFRNIPKKPLDQVVDEYIAATDRPKFVGLLRYWAQAWELFPSKHAELIGYSKAVFNENKPNAKAVVTDILDSYIRRAEEITGSTVSLATKEKIYKIKYGQSLNYSTEDYADFALAIIKTDKAKISNFKDNPVVQYLLLPNFEHAKEQDAIIDKSKIPAAFIFCTLGPRGFSRFLYDAGAYELLQLPKEDLPSVDDYKKGNRHFIVKTCEDNGVIQYDERRYNLAKKLAKPLANGDEALEKKIVTVLLVNKIYYTPENVVQLIDEGKLKLATAMRSLRYQAGLSLVDIARMAGSSEEVSANIEKKNGHVRSVDMSQALAMEICNVYSQSNVAGKFADVLIGKIAPPTIDDVEREIGRSYKCAAEKHITANQPANPRAKSHYELFQMMVLYKDGPNKIAHFSRQLTYIGFNGQLKHGISPGTIDGWSKGKFADFIEAPKAIAERVGLNPDASDKFVELFCNKVRAYNPAHIQSLRDIYKSDMSLIPQVNRVMLLENLVADAKFNKSAFARALGITRIVLTLIMGKGQLNQAHDTNALASKITEILIPVGFENDRYWLSELLQSSPRVSSEFSKRLIVESRANEVAVRI